MKNTIRLFNTSIHIGNDALTRLNERLKENFHDVQKVILADENTFTWCLPLVRQHCKSLKREVVITIDSGELNKSLETARYIWNKLAANFIGRDALIINVGGGVLCDIGSFCASTYKRGISFINVPTTLLAMADAATGGKTGIDLKDIKNLVGTFANPDSIFVFPGFLGTLDERNKKCGFAEMIKHVLIADSRLWKNFIITPYEECISEKNILRSIKIKSQIVKKDPKEVSLRKILNFGHTSAHAVETWSLQHDIDPLLHGECVAMGMVIESYLSFATSTLPKNDTRKIAEFIDKHFLLRKLDSKSVNEICRNMQHDKKNVKGLVNFTLLDQIGKASNDHFCELRQIKEAFGFYNSIAE